MFNEKYFTSGNYEGGYDNLERLLRMREISRVLGGYVFPKTVSMIVDYGAATGLLLREISQRAFATVIGVDISQFALGEISRRGGFALDSHVYPSLSINPDTVISLDVFEHMTDEEIKVALKNKPKNLIIRIPVKQFENDKEFFLECSNKDETHINCKTREGWIVFFEKLGYRFDRDFFEDGLIYSSNGVFTGIFSRK